MQVRKRHWWLWASIGAVLLAVVATILLARSPATRHLVRVGVYENAPKIYTNRNGKPAGLYIELLRRIASEEHWSIDYVHCTWKHCLAMLRDGRIDLMPDVAYSAARAKTLDFNSIAVVHGWSQVYARAGLDIRSIEDLANLRVAMLSAGIQESYFDDLMKSSGLRFTPVPVNTFDQGFRAVAQGRADAVITNNFYPARHAKLGNTVETPILFQPVGLYFATAKGHHDDLLRVIDGYLDTWQLNPDSIYYTALRQSLAPGPIQVVPPGLEAGLLIALVLVLLFVAASLILRWQVRQRTAALSRTTRHLDDVLRASPAVIYRLRERGDRMLADWISPNIQRLYGFTVEEALYPGWLYAQLHPEDREQAIRRLETLPRQGGDVIEYRIIDARGKTRHLRDERHLIPAQGDQPRTLIGTWNDLTESHMQAERVDFLTYHDELTRLPNRKHLMRSLSRAIERARQNHGMLAVLWIDLDHFKNINDTQGHDIGDAVLVRVASTLRGLLDEDDLLARMGGDEFAVLLARETGVHHAIAMAQRVLSSFAEPVPVEEQHLALSASIGISMYPEHGDDAESLLRDAEVAMYESKNRGRDTWCLFDDRLSSRVSQRVSMENALRGAVGRGEMEMHYQPQFDLHNGQLVGIEALVRWRHPEAGLLAPGNFIALAEENGEIHPIGRWVLNESCRQLVTWRRQGLAVPSISVNLSVRQLERGELVTLVAKVLADTGLDAASLELELTESMIMRDPEQATSALDALKDLGVKLSVDDFGTGHSSLAYLKKLPLDRLKIDRSFVRDIGSNPDDEAICHTVIELARQMGLSTVAEGVEREDQVDFLRREGCGIAQGYLFCKPLPADELAAFWRERLAGTDTTAG